LFHAPLNVKSCTLKVRKTGEDTFKDLRPWPKASQILDKRSYTVSPIGANLRRGQEGVGVGGLSLGNLHWGHLSSLPLSEAATTRVWYSYYQRRGPARRRTQQRWRLGTRPQRKRMGTDGGVDESVVQPAADEGEVPSLAAGFSFGGRSGGGEWVGGGVSPLSSQTESESKREKPTFKPRLRFVPRFLLAFPLRLRPP
jgi:hypothetical protein